MKVIITALAALALAGCGIASVDAGKEKVLVAKPWIFGSGGVYDTPVSTGTAIVAWSTEEIEVNMQPQRYNLEINDLMSRDGVPLDFDAAAVFQVTDSVALIKRYGPKWYSNNIQSELLSYVRDEVKKYGLNETAISSEAVAKIDSAVTERMEAYLKKQKFPVRLVTLTVGKANPPDAIKNQRIQTSEQEQRLITLEKAKLAEIKRKESEAARAEADNAYRTNMSLSPEQFVQLKSLETLSTVCAKSTCNFYSNGVTGALLLK